MPIFENTDNLANEEWAARKVEALWACQLRKLPHKDFLDFEVYKSGKLAGWLEFRHRELTWEQLERKGGLWLSKHKFDHAMGLSEKYDLHWVFLVEDKLFDNRWAVFRHDDDRHYKSTISKWGQNNTDREPCRVLYLPVELFRPL